MRWWRTGPTTTSPSGCRPLEGHQSGVEQEVFAEVAVVVFASALVYICMYLDRRSIYSYTSFTQHPHSVINV